MAEDHRSPEVRLPPAFRWPGGKRMAILFNFGRPSGAWVWERIMEIAAGASDVWIGTGAGVTAHARAALG